MAAVFVGCETHDGIVEDLKDCEFFRSFVDDVSLISTPPHAILIWIVMYKWIYVRRFAQQDIYGKVD